MKVTQPSRAKLAQLRRLEREAEKWERKVSHAPENGWVAMKADAARRDADRLARSMGLPCS